MHTKIVKLKEYDSKEVGFLVQAVLMEMLLIFGIINLINDIFMPIFYVLIFMIMFTMAYNNKKVYKRKYMTGIYLTVGTFILITTLLEYVF